MSADLRRTNRQIELLEESLQLLRSAGAPHLLQHWSGSIPFAVAILITLRDMSLSWGKSLLLRDSLACAITFVWLSYWRSRTSRSIFSLLSSSSKAFGSWGQQLVLQTIFQTLKLLVMPFAAASILAWPAACVFFRTLALEPLSEERPLRSGLQRALASVTRQYAENAVAFLMIAVLTFVTWLNMLVTIILVPSLWKMLTGYETDWSRMQNSAVFGLFAVAAVATWLLIDPWIQTYCVLRVFYQSARFDGRDLLRDIARLAMVAILLITAMPSQSQTAPQSERAQSALNRAIHDASQSQEYGWLRPDKTEAPSGFLEDLAQKVNEAASWAGKRVQRWYEAFRNWVKDRLGDNNTPITEKTDPKSPVQELRWTLALLAALICGGIVALFFRSRKRASANSDSAEIPVSTADVLNERMLPTDVNHEEWLRLAYEYLQKNQTRLSARAFYLANLSYLGTQSLLALSSSKTNRIYERELARQPKSSQLLPAFAASNGLYERAWYGMRELGEEQIELLKGAVGQLRHHD